MLFGNRLATSNTNVLVNSFTCDFSVVLFILCNGTYILSTIVKSLKSHMYFLGKNFLLKIIKTVEVLTKFRKLLKELKFFFQ